MRNAITVPEEIYWGENGDSENKKR